MWPRLWIAASASASRIASGRSSPTGSGAPIRRVSGVVARIVSGEVQRGSRGWLSAALQGEVHDNPPVHNQYMQIEAARGDLRVHAMRPPPENV